MKLKTLKIKNIASIEDAIIPFDKKPLSTETLFLITGDTGSGKSTILNSICLALYHTTPNLETYGSPKEKTFDELGTDSPIQMMRRGCDNASVQLTFQANNGNVYLSTWAIRKRKKRGKEQNYDTTTRLECIENYNANADRETTLTKATEIKKRIPELVGFNLDQFTRTTLLAQGQFSRFLYAKPAEKTSILEKLTGTELFAQIGMEIFRLSKEADKNHDVLQEKINSIHLLDDDEKAQLNNEIAEGDKKRSVLDRKIKEVSKQADWVTHKDIKQQALQQKRNQLVKAQEEVASERFAQQKTTLEKWDYTLDVRNAMVSAQLQQQQYESLREQILGLQQSYNSLIEGFRYLEDTLTKTTDDHAKLETILEQQSPNEEMYNAAAEISRLSTNIGKLRAEALLLEKEIQLRREEIESSQKKEAVLKENASKAIEAYENQERITTAQRELCKDNDTKALSTAYNQLAELEMKMRQALKDIEDYRQKLSEMQLSQLAFEVATKDIETLTSQLNKAKETLPTLQQQFDLAKAQFEGSLELSEHIVLIRGYFSTHNQCPLCGTEGVSLYTDEQLQQNKLAAQHAKQLAEANLNNQKDLISQLTTKLAVLNKDAKSKESEFSRKNKSYQQAKTNVGTQAHVLSFDYEDPEAISKLQMRIEEASEQKVVKKAEFDKAVELQKKAELETKRLDTLRKEKEKAEKALQSQQEKTKDSQNKLSLSQSRLEQTLRNAESMLAQAKALILLPQGAPEVTYDSLPALSERISKEAQQYKQWQKQADTLSRKIESLSTEIESSKRNLQPLSAKYTTAEVVHPRPIKDLSGAIAQLNTQVSTLEGKRAQSLEQYKQYNDQVNQWLEQNPEYTPEELKLLQQITLEQSQKIRSYLTHTQNQLTAATEAYKTIETDLNQWLAQRPEIEESFVMELLEANGIEANGIKTNTASEEQLKLNHESDHDSDLESESVAEGWSDSQDNNEASPNLTEEMNVFSLTDLLSKDMLNEAVKAFQSNEEEISKVIYQNQARLRQNQELELSIAKDKEELARLEKIKNDWQILAKKFGGADGKAFRDIAQSYVLRLLLQQANYYLGKLSTRYELACDDGSLTINIIDKFQSGSVRNVTSLSGGESFVVSLALALGLSAINPQKINVDILFIDEGFGTLDKEILDTVITSLDQLHMINGRRIGLISHVETLKERIPTQIQVTRSGSSSSKVKIVPEPSED